jgi:hypothetical protein
MGDGMMIFTLLLLLPALSHALIDRQSIVSKFNIVRTSLIDNETTPLQVGNGNFAYNVDNTGMQVRRMVSIHRTLGRTKSNQTFLPFNTLSSWAWHNDSLPTDG